MNFFHFNILTKKAGTAFLCAMLFAAPMMMAGCTNEESTSSAEQNEFADAQTLLVAAWEKDNDEDKPVIIGGAGDSISEELPMALDLSDPDVLVSALNVPEELIEASKSGASMMNGMMANSFTVSAWQLKDPSKMQTLAKETADKIKNAEWVCSFPEEYQILQCDDFLVCVYGLKDQTGPFIKALEKTVSSSKVLEQGSISD